VIPKEALMRPIDAISYFKNNRITFLKLTPSLLRLFLQESAESKIKLFNSEFLRLIFLGGEKIDQIDIKSIKDDFPDLEIINHYGPTETTIGVIANKITDLDKPISLGRPINNIQVYILNDLNQMAPIGVYGEICISGESVSKGYLNNIELNADKFVINPHRPNEILYKTGDIGRWLHCGEIEFLGRKDSQIKFNGFRVELSEIEKAIKNYPSIIDCVVDIVTSDESKQKKIISYVVGSFNSDFLKMHLEQFLPRYMIPSLFIRLDKIPVTTNGKLDKGALPLPNFIESGSIDHLPPRTENERILIDIYAEILGYETFSISVKDDFFELGGNSISAIRLINKINRGLNIKLLITDVFLHSELEAMARLLDGLNNNSTSIYEIEL
jgi:acyl-coenzyme A synthetase/AMP-(fatty) acid ligase